MEDLTGHFRLELLGLSALREVAVFMMLQGFVGFLLHWDKHIS